VDYDQLTQLLKEEELEEVQPEELPMIGWRLGRSVQADLPPEEVVTIETLIERIAKETDPTGLPRSHRGVLAVPARGTPTGRSISRCRR